MVYFTIQVDPQIWECSLSLFQNQDSSWTESDRCDPEMTFATTKVYVQNDVITIHAYILNTYISSFQS